MRYVYHEVNVVKQATPNSCWHDSALVIWRFWQRQGRPAGPMMTNPKAYADDRGGVIRDFKFVKESGMFVVPTYLFRNLDFSANDLYRLLSVCGPLWCSGRFPAPHAIVLTGILEETLYFADVADGGYYECSLAWFNRCLFKDFGAMRAGVPVIHADLTSNAANAQFKAAPPLPPRNKVTHCVTRPPPDQPRQRANGRPPVQCPPALPPRPNGPTVSGRSPPPLPPR